MTLPLPKKYKIISAVPMSKIRDIKLKKISVGLSL
jgi:hypothetical protein